jgi:XTP/dITP diphosphohydrolase
MQTIVIASGNLNKVREFQQLLAPLNVEILPQSQFGVPEAEEPHVTFVENALAKARHASRLTGHPALADDSGICVHALGGAPGVISARYAGEPRSDERNNARLLADLEPHRDRRAHYHCVLVLLHHADDPQPLIAEASWQGEILREPRGNGGFGYDPLFLDPVLGQTGAEMPLALKNRVSHRGQAMALLLQKMQQSLP